jgi:hypothetical protein
MVFVHKPYYNPKYTNPKKVNPSDICPKPKKLYKIYKLYDAELKKHRENFRNQNLKLLNYKHLLTKTKKINLKKKIK